MIATTATTTAIEPVRAADQTTGTTVQPLRRPADFSAWARYVEHAQQATLFHHPLWSRIVETVFGHRPGHLLAKRGEQLVGVLPLLEVRSFLAGRLLVSVPYGTYGGILADDEEAHAALATAALQLVRQRQARVLTLRSVTADVPAWPRDGRYVSFTRTLPERYEDLAAFLPRKARAAARQAREREHLSVQHDAGHLGLVWQLYCRSMRRLASLNYPFAFFEALAHRLGEHAWVTTVWQGMRPVAGLLSFVFRDTVLPYFVGVDERIRCAGSMNLLYFATMERAVRYGLRRFDFGRSRLDNEGPAAFKRNQGFEPRLLGYQYYVPPGVTAPDLSPANPRFDLARRVWRHLPLPLTRPLGAWLSKAIPG
ncbi:MAG: FemAB family PEP-CTERM system-associated protein [Planctomycetes bacterium]|nr:FemAB family PEP-CTERM system-associated protein [Planctomycetota bacterium]